MIWDFSEGIIFRTVFGLEKFTAESAESIVNLILGEFKDVQRYEVDPFLAYLSLHQKIASTLNGEEAQSSFYKSAQHRVRQWGEASLLAFKYENLEFRIVVTQNVVFVLVPYESDEACDDQIPELVAKKISTLLGGRYNHVKKVKDISWYTNGDWNH